MTARAKTHFIFIFNLTASSDGARASSAHALRCRLHTHTHTHARARARSHDYRNRNGGGGADDADEGTQDASGARTQRRGAARSGRRGATGRERERLSGAEGSAAPRSTGAVERSVRGRARVHRGCPRLVVLGGAACSARARAPCLPVLHREAAAARARAEHAIYGTLAPAVIHLGGPPVPRPNRARVVSFLTALQRPADTRFAHTGRGGAARAALSTRTPWSPRCTWPS